MSRFKGSIAEIVHKYASLANVVDTLVNDFIGYVCKAKSNESKIVELKSKVMKLYNDLKVVKKHHQLSLNEWLLTQIVKKILQQFKVRFSKCKASRMAVEGAGLWQITSSFLKEEALRFENDLPWLLDSHKEEASFLPTRCKEAGGCSAELEFEKRKIR